MHDLERNKANVIAFYELMFNACRPAEAVERFVGDEYIQHNPHVATGTAGFIANFERMAREWPGKRVEIKRGMSGNEWVVLLCFQHWPGDHDYAGIDIFRLGCDVLSLNTPGWERTRHLLTVARIASMPHAGISSGRMQAYLQVEFVGRFVPIHAIQRSPDSFQNRSQLR